MKFMVIIYLLIPLIAYAYPFEFSSTQSFIEFLLPNYLLLAAPLLLWMSIAGYFRFNKHSFHIGCITASISQIGFIIAFIYFIDNSSGGGWLVYYLPVTILLTFFFGILSFLWFEIFNSTKNEGIE